MKPKILIVDDEPNLLKLLEYNLKKTFDVFLKNDGDEAIQWLNQGNVPDLIVLDIMMHDMDGSELLKNIRKNSALDKVPVVFLTAKSPRVDEINPLIEAADDYIVKPFDIDELLGSIKNLLPATSDLHG